MHDPQDARPRARSPFTAAFLSLLFPGLGHLYAGAPSRALAFAAAPVLVIALLAGIVLRLDRIELLGLVLNPFLLSSVFAANLIALLYRLVAIIDAYRVAEYMNALTVSGDGRLGRARMPRHPLSVAGLLAVLLVMAGSHVAVARYDMLALDLLNSGCIFVGGQVDPGLRRRCERHAARRAIRPPLPSPSRAPSGHRSRTSRSRRGTARSGSTSC